MTGFQIALERQVGTSIGLQCEPSKGENRRKSCGAASNAMYNQPAQILAERMIL